MKEQRLELVRGDKTEKVNTLLKEGWVVVNLSSMADKAYSDTACYMVLEKETLPQPKSFSTLPEKERDDLFNGIMMELGNSGLRGISPEDFERRVMCTFDPSEKPLIPEVDYDKPICNGSGTGGKDEI